MSSKRRLLRGSYQNIIDLYEGTPDNIRIEGYKLIDKNCV